MFGIGLPELLLIGLVALFVVDPKDLPKFLYQCGRVVRSFRLILIQAQHTVEETFRDLEADQINANIKKLEDKNTPLLSSERNAEEIIDIVEHSQNTSPLAGEVEIDRRPIEGEES